MIDGAFAFVSGLGPSRERELYKTGVRCWSDFPKEGVVLAAKLDDRIRAGIGEMQQLLDEERWEQLAARLPLRDHWRFIPVLATQLTYLDIETTAAGTVTVIGLYDAVRGPRTYVRGHNLGRFLDERPVALATFNGAAFDVPMLMKTFPTWRPPLHIDLRFTLRQLREGGGLKSLEDRLGFGRPLHLKGVGGLDAIGLWDRFRRDRDPQALFRLLEYNLYDAIQLRTLAEIACERLSERTGRPWAPPHRFNRGDVLLDLSRVVEAVVAEASRIEPDEFHDEERRSLRGVKPPAASALIESRRSPATPLEVRPHSKIRSA